jgi:hypothetical protein
LLAPKRSAQFRFDGGMASHNLAQPSGEMAACDRESKMSKRNELIAKYANDLKTKCGMEPDMALLEKVTIGCGPAIYSADSETVAASDPEELGRVKKSFLVKKLGLADGPALDEALGAAIDTYGKSERNKYRAVVYYMLVKHFRKESVYA